MNYDLVRMRRGCYIIGFHDGIKTHKDGSPFRDGRLFTNQKDADKFIKELRAKGYSER